MNAYEIESAVKATFTADAATGFKEVDVSKIPTTLSRPGFSVAAISGKDDVLTMSGDAVNETTRIVVTLVVSSLADEEQRRKVMMPLIRAVQVRLVGSDLGLSGLSPVRPAGWTEVTSADDMAKCLMIAEVYFDVDDEFDKETAAAPTIASIMHYFDDADGDTVVSADENLKE